MKTYQAIKEETATFCGQPVEAESIRDALKKLGFGDFDVQSEELAMAWWCGDAYSVAPLDED